MPLLRSGLARVVLVAVQVGGFAGTPPAHSQASTRAEMRPIAAWSVPLGAPPA